MINEDIDVGMDVGMDAEMDLDEGGDQDPTFLVGRVLIIESVIGTVVWNNQ